MGSSNHSIMPLQERTAFRCNVRQGRGYCGQPVTHQVSYDYVTGLAGRTGTCRLLRCAVHASKFAAKHGLEYPDPAPAGGPLVPEEI